MCPVTLYRTQVPTEKYSNQKMHANKTARNHTQQIKFLQCFSARAPSSGNPKYKGLQVPIQQSWYYINTT